jgi:ubiquitin C-terminal hydrolase
MKKNNPPNNIKIKNITSNTPSNVKTIPIPNNIKKDNFIFDPNKPVYQKVTNKIQPHPSDKIIRNNMPNVTNINTKGHNVKQIQSEPKNTIRNITNIHNNKELEEKNKIIVDNNKPENIIGQTTQEKIAQNGPQDNKEDLSKYVIEITDNNNNQYIDIIPENTFKYRALTQDDFNQIFLKGVGIINLGNTCFINSCLQALIHCKLFIQLFFSKGIQMKEDTTPISYHFLLLCIEMLDVQKRSHINYIDISYFKYIFGKKHPMFNGFAQNDSQEFCRIFLEDLSTELNEAKNKNIYRTLTNTDNKSKIVKDNEFFINFKERENSIINDLFYSQIITSFKCKCGSEIYSFQKIMDFPLLLPENVNQINIKKLLNNYFKSEVVDFEKKCDKCQQILKHNKEMRISRPPEILILSLQRINETTKKKNNCAVAFGEQLNIYEYIDHELGFDKECDYTLFSIINHVGDMDVGHYFTYIKPLGIQNWYEFNDSTVRKIVPRKTVFSYAYALLYIKSKYK